jgi:hypothetical protein
MGFTRNVARTACVVGFLIPALGAPLCRAQCDHTTYGYEDRVVVNVVQQSRCCRVAHHSEQARNLPRLRENRTNCREQDSREKWSIAEVPPSKELEKRMSGRASEWRFADQNERSVVVREAVGFRYELAGREKSSTVEILHRQYLRKVDLATEQTASELLPGEHLETID